jgi:apolipoprotein N-acyltransferase
MRSLKMSSLSRLLSLAILSGIGIGLSRSCDLAGILIFISYIPLLKILESQIDNKKQFFLVAATYSLSTVIVGLHWIGLVTVPGVFGISILFTIYNLITFKCIRQIWTLSNNFYFKMFAFIAVMLSSELLQTLTEFRFPWMNAGYSLVGFLPLIQFADIGGVYLISTLIFIINYLLHNINRKNIIVTITILAIWVSLGYVRLNSIPDEVDNFKISVVQPSIGQQIKWDNNVRDYIVTTIQNLTLSEKGKTNLVIWPESALPYYMAKNSRMRKYVGRLAKSIEAPIFLGYQDYTYNKSNESYLLYNTASLIDSTSLFKKPYFKQKLVPFGERIPLLDIFPILWNLHLGQANFEYGKENVVFDVENKKFCPLICFEIVSDALTYDMFNKGVDFIVNISNDAWFYNSIGTYQHSRMAVFRAIETRRPLVRCANTGFSFLVDHKGRILDTTDIYEVVTKSYNLPISNMNPIYMTKFFYYTWIWVIVTIVLLSWSVIKSFRVKRR